MKPKSQTITLRGILLVPAPGVWIIRLARLAAAKWARLNGVRISHASVVPATEEGEEVLGYHVRVTIPAEECPANFRRSHSCVSASPPIALA